MEPVTAQIPGTLFRIGRSGALIHYSEITPADATLATAGNRYDVAGGSVLYAATHPRACYAETLARFRPTPGMRALLADDPDPGFMMCGGVPRDWRLQRSLGDLVVVDPLPFLDVESAATQAFLSVELASEMVALGYQENLDISQICGHDRRLSRAISRYAYTMTDDDGGFIYGGVRYCSRIDPEWECWAVFEGTQCYVQRSKAIDLADEDLQYVADLWDLRIF